MKKVFPFLLVVGVAIWSVWHEVLCLSCVPDFGRDGELITWIINTAGKNIYGLHSGVFGGVFDGGIFYPYKNVLAYSEMFFLTAFWTYLIGQLANNWRIVFGLAMVFGQVATMVVSYLWWQKMASSRWAAAVCTVIFGLSQIRMHYQVHLQMWSMQYMLVGLWLVYEWLQDRKNWKLFVGAGILGLMVWESLLPVVFAGSVIGVWGVMGKIQVRKYLRQTLLAGLIVILIGIWPALAYLNVSREFGYARSIRDAAHNGMSVDELVGRFASPGIYLAALVGGFYMWKKRRETWQRKDVKWMAVVAVLALVMALGPVLKWDGKTVKFWGDLFVPLPYTVAHYLVPGFGAFRTPSRWIWLFAWMLSGLSAIVIGRVGKSGWRKAIGLTMLLWVGVVGGERVEKLRGQDPGDGVAAYEWLSQQSGEVILVLPLTNDESQLDPMVGLVGSGKKLVNGYSGFMPPETANLGQRVNGGIGTWETWGEIEERGIDWVVIDAERIVVSGSGLEGVWVGYEDRRYKIIPVNRGGAK